MPDTADSEPLGSPLLQGLYGAGYFHGENSSFAREGYDRAHATWRHWMPWMESQVGIGARWLDLGCAYGFLVAEACEAGFQAIGLDASRYALGQVQRHAPIVHGRVLLAHAERLPFANASFDVVSAFDLLEHVPSPERVLHEAARVLRPGGLFLAATPDPLVFHREEPTHLAERVPSWWVRALERAGFSVALRFFQAEYNCELVGRRDGPAPCISFDSLANDPVLECQGDAHLKVALRSGFGHAEVDGGRVVSDGAWLYLLNTGHEPLEVAVSLQTREPSAIRLTLDGRVIVRARCDATRAETRLLLPSGGHALRLGVERGWARLVQLRCVAAPAERGDLCLTLPFDLYERYALSAEVVRRLAPRARRLVDVGGTMGAGQGHLGWSGDFFPGLDVTVVDERGVDLPEHRVLRSGGPLPFADREIEVVGAQDVLEHIPASDRPAWLEEVWRITDGLLLLGGPFATDGVEEADRYLCELIREQYGYEHGFLAEHLRHGHPDLDATRRFFLARGGSVSVVPSGYLPGWLLMQTVNARLSHPEQDLGYVRANQAMNRALDLGANAAPAYRHLLVIDRSGVSHDAALCDLGTGRPADPRALRGLLATLAAEDMARRGSA